MLIGSPLPGIYSNWRFVDADLYDISRRVTEYDADCRLVRSDDTGQLGLARWIPLHALIHGGSWALVKWLHDPATGEPLAGEPDQRILDSQIASDSFRLSNQRGTHRKLESDHERREARRRYQAMEENMPHAERMVWEHARNDKMLRNTISVPRGF